MTVTMKYCLACPAKRGTYPTRSVPKKCVTLCLCLVFIKGIYFLVKIFLQLFGRGKIHVSYPRIGYFIYVGRK